MAEETCFDIVEYRVCFERRLDASRFHLYGPKRWWSRRRPLLFSGWMEREEEDQQVRCIVDGNRLLPAALLQSMLLRWKALQAELWVDRMAHLQEIGNAR